MASLDIHKVKPDEPLPLDRLSIADVKYLVGRECLDVRVQNKWIALFFSTCCVKIRKW